MYCNVLKCIAIFCFLFLITQFFDQYFHWWFQLYLLKTEVFFEISPTYISNNYLDTLTKNSEKIDFVLIQ